MISKPMIFDEVALGLAVRGVPEAEIKERVHETLKICGLYPFRNWPISALSFGQKKRVTIASILVMNPEVLILDEPTKGIDVGAKSEFYQMICEFAKQGLGVILISSELPEVIGLSDRIIVMKGRKIVGEVSREEATESRLLSLGMIGEVQES